MNKKQCLVQKLLLCTFFSLASTRVHAQITPDSTLGGETSKLVPSVLINNASADLINGGAQRGNNLFHSFSEFNINPGQRVYFGNPSGVVNILTRVTGSNASNIFGTLGVDGAANLFLINPNGILFGKNASLDLRGSFVGTTANGVQFGNQGNFSATNPEAPGLLTINPSALFFNQINPNAAIVNNSVAPSKKDPATSNLIGLRVPDGKSLSLVGGNVSLNNSTIQAPDGQVNLSGIAGAGEIELLFNQSNLNLIVPVNIERADISLTNDSVINVANQGMGNVNIASRNLYLSGNSRIIAGIEEGKTSQETSNINIQATGRVKLTDNSLIENRANRGSIGNAGNINIDANALEINGGRISTRTLGQGDAGDINIKASSIYIDNPAYEMPGQNSDLEDKPALNAGNYQNDSDNGSGFGRSGNISLTSNGNITLIGRGEDRENKVISIYSNANGKGRGSISLYANGSILISNAYISSPNFDGGRGDVSLFGREAVSIVDNSLFRSGTGAEKAGDIKIETQGLFLLKDSFLDTGVGDFSQAGDITVKAGEILVNQSVSSPGQGAFFAASTGKGYSGRVFLEAKGAMTLIGNDINIDDVLISTFANIEALKGGDVSLKANSIALSNAYLKTGSEIANGGNISVFGKEFVSIDNNSSLLSGTNAGKSGNITIQSSGPISISQSLLLSGVGGRKNTNAIGGDINISGSFISIRDGSEITARASREAIDFLPGGASGNINVNATSEVEIAGRASYPFKDTARAVKTIYTALLTSSGPTANGPAGKIIINTPVLRLLDGASLRAESQGGFQGGEIIVNTKVIELNNGGKILTSALGNGNAGNITLNATDNINIVGSNYNIGDTFKQVFFDEGEIEAKIKLGTNNPASGVFADTSIDSTGKGGNLNINTPKLTINRDAQMSVTGQGTGAAGNLTVNANIIQLNQGRLTADTSTGEGANISLNNVKLLQLDNQSLISAKASNGANGGNINVNSDLLLLRRGSKISTNAGTDQKGGDGGNININSTFTVAVPFEDSDITANAFNGKGGNVTITKRNQGIFGIEARSKESPSTSDITASSENGAQGEVSIARPETDPNRGLIELPTNLVDASQQIATGCTPRNRRTASKFISTGRGGIPENPYEPLRKRAVINHWVTLPNNENQQTTEIKEEVPTPKQIVEAQSWVLNSRGEVELVAQAPTDNFHTSSQQAAFSCNAQTSG